MRTKTGQTWEPSEQVTGLLGWIIVLLGVLLFFVNSITRMLWMDEFLTVYTSQLGSIRQLLYVQSHFPLGIEPPLYDMTTHIFLHMVPHSATAARLTAGLGIATLLVSVYQFLSHLEGKKVALTAVLILMGTSASYYADEARPYGLMLGLGGLVFLCWQALRREGNTRRKPFLLFALFLSTAMCLNTHYFAVLIPLPIFAAEAGCLLSAQRPRWDALFAITAGYTSVLAWIPFLKAAHRYSENFYVAPKWSQLKVAYPGILSMLSVSFHLKELVCAIVFLGVSASIVRLFKNGRLAGKEYSPEWIALSLCCLLPFPGMILAFVVRSSLEPRYVLFTLIGIAALLAYFLCSSWNTRRAWTLTVTAIIALIAVEETFLLHTNNQHSTLEMQPLPEHEALSHPIVIADLGKFIEMEYIASDSEKNRIVYLYSREDELKHSHSDFMTLTATALASFNSLPIFDYSSYKKNHSQISIALWSDLPFAFPGMLTENVQSVRKKGPWTIYNIVREDPESKDH